MTYLIPTTAMRNYVSEGLSESNSACQGFSVGCGVCVQNSGRNPPRGGTYIVNISKQTTLRSLSLFVTSIKNKAVIHRDYMLRLFSFCNNFVRHINTIPHKTIRIIEKKHIYI